MTINIPSVHTSTIENSPLESLEVCMCFTYLSQAYEDAHGQLKGDLKQQILLPHEIVDCFIREGELRRMIGDGDLQLILHHSSNTCYVCQVFLYIPSVGSNQISSAKDLADFWTPEKGTKWFKQHPILGDSWMKSWGWNLCEFQYQTWQCVLGWADNIMRIPPRRCQLVFHTAFMAMGQKLNASHLK